MASTFTSADGLRCPRFIRYFNDKQRPYFYDQQTGVTSWTKPKCDVWETDRATNPTYYRNLRTGEKLPIVYDDEDSSPEEKEATEDSTTSNTEVTDAEPRRALQKPESVDPVLSAEGSKDQGNESSGKRRKRDHLQTATSHSGVKVQDSKRPKSEHVTGEHREARPMRQGIESDGTKEKNKRATTTNSSSGQPSSSHTTAPKHKTSNTIAQEPGTSTTVAEEPNASVTAGAELETSDTTGAKPNTSTSVTAGAEPETSDTTGAKPTSREGVVDQQSPSQTSGTRLTEVEELLAHRASVIGRRKVKRFCSHPLELPLVPVDRVQEEDLFLYSELGKALILVWNQHYNELIAINQKRPPEGPFVDTPHKSVSYSGVREIVIAFMRRGILPSGRQIMPVPKLVEHTLEIGRRKMVQYRYDPLRLPNIDISAKEASFLENPFGQAWVKHWDGHYKVLVQENTQHRDSSNFLIGPPPHESERCLKQMAEMYLATGHAPELPTSDDLRSQVRQFHSIPQPGRWSRKYLTRNESGTHRLSLRPAPFKYVHRTAPKPIPIAREPHSHEPRSHEPRRPAALNPGPSRATSQAPTAATQRARTSNKLPLPKTSNAGPLRTERHVNHVLEDSIVVVDTLGLASGETIIVSAVIDGVPYLGEVQAIAPVEQSETNRELLQTAKLNTGLRVPSDANQLRAMAPAAQKRFIQPGLESMRRVYEQLGPADGVDFRSTITAASLDRSEAVLTRAVNGTSDYGGTTPFFRRTHHNAFPVWTDGELV